MKQKFSCDEITTIRTAARLAWTRISEELDSLSTAVQLFDLEPIETIEIIEAVANNEDIEETLKTQGHTALAERFAKLEPEAIVELLTPEFQLH